MNANNQLRILHLSDLHICDLEVKKGLEEILALFKTFSNDLVRMPELDFEFADGTRLTNIKEAVEDLKPDIICVTGDLTTFGDKASFDLVYTFLAELRSSINKKPKIVVTPGNHDVLCSNLRKLMENVLLDKFAQELPFWVTSYLKCSSKGKDIVKAAKDFKNIREKVSKVLAMNEVSPDKDNPLVHYKNLECRLGNDLAIQRTEGTPSIGGCEVRCIPFNSVSLDPLWLNIGEGSANEFRAFRAKLKDANETPGSMVVALLHHNPISSAAIVDSHLKHGYDSFPGASLYVKEMQDAGADIILYGHQHKESVCQMDFIPSDPGHLYLIGASSATAPTGGFNVIDLHDRYHGVVQHYQFVARSGRHKKEPENKVPLVFEYKREDDVVTLCSRFEVRHFTRDKLFEQEEDQAFEPGAEEILIVRPRGVGLQTKQGLGRLRKLLEHESNKSVKILVSDPGLFNLINGLGANEKQQLSEMWGKQHTWAEQALEATATLDRLIKFKNGLVGALKDKLFIHKAHTLVPVGAVLRKEPSKQDMLFLRLLPVGVDIDRSELILERRHVGGLSSFYIEYLEELWTKGKEHVQGQ